MPTVVVHDIAAGIADLAWGFQDMGVVAVGEDAALATGA